MIFNIGENPTLDVVRMLMQYAVVQQQKKSEPPRTIKKNVVVENKVSSVTTPSTPILSATTASTNGTDGPRRLHVTNLPFKTKDHELRAMFSLHGTVLDAEIIYNERGSKGFGFVTMETTEGAAKAKNALNEKEMEGRKIKVNNATPRSVPNKGVPKLQNRSPSHVMQNQVTGLLFNKQTIPNILPSWSTTALNNVTMAPLRNNQFQFAFTPTPHVTPIPPTINLNSTAAPISGLSCFPTPEQYAEYYNYVSTHGPFHGNLPSSNHPSLGNYRFQPY